jgi:glycosyltransferase involved in cell wall biosynthesis
MKIWLITIGEPLPTDGPNERLLRTGILAGMLSNAGHEVLWWTSSFDHVRKTHRVEQDTSIQITDNYRLVMLRSSGYQRNISVARLTDHREHARKFTVLAPSESVPDVILCSMPTIELSRAAVQYAIARNIPIALDIRDLWPDIFVDHAPPWTQGLARLLLQPLFRDLRWACSKATAITGITAPIVAWGLSYADRPRTDLDRDFPLGYVEQKPTNEEIENARTYWKEHGIGCDPHEFVICFFGTIGRQFDLDTVIEAARRLNGGTRPFRFVLCGTGDRLSHYQNRAHGLSNVVFPGWVGASEIWVLMRLAKLGLAPYCNTKDFRSSLPNKSIEYLSSGLPLVSCLTGVLHNLLERNNCGVTYAEGDVGSLVSILEQSFDNRHYLYEKAHNALKLYKEMYTADRVYTNMMIYLETLARSGDSSKIRDEFGTDLL